MKAGGATVICMQECKKLDLVMGSAVFFCVVYTKRKEGSLIVNPAGSPAWLHLSALPHISHLTLPRQ